MRTRLSEIAQGRLLVLLVILVPHIVPLAFVSTALGAHKSVSLLFSQYETGNLGLTGPTD